jgi:hypothetical protein
MAQLLRIPRVLNHQIDTAITHGIEDRRLLSLKVKLVLPPRRRGHERQTQPEPIQPRPLPNRTQAPHHTETK